MCEETGVGVSTVDQFCIGTVPTPRFPSAAGGLQGQQTHAQRGFVGTVTLWDGVEPSWPWGEENLRTGIGGKVAPLSLGTVVPSSL